MARIIVIALLIFISIRVTAQADFRAAYIIDLEGDTIKGFVDYREGSKNFDICEFKKSEGASSVSYIPNQIIGYRFYQDKYFESKTIQDKDGNSEDVFLEVLVNGTATLFKYKSRFFVSKGEKFYELKSETNEQRINGRRMKVESNEHIGILSYLLHDCDGIQAKINDTKLMEIELTKLIEKYNRCTGEFTVTFKERKKWFNMVIGLGTGLMQSSLTFDTDDFDLYRHLRGGKLKSFSPLFGLEFEVYSPKINEQLRFYSGFYYINSIYQLNFEETRFIYMDRHDVEFELSHVKIPIGIRYYLPEKTITPFFNVGFSSTFHLKRETHWTREREFNGSIVTTEGEAFRTDSFQLGFWGGIGIKLRFIPQLTSNLEFRYEVTDGVNKENNLTSGIHNMQILLSIRF